MLRWLASLFAPKAPPAINRPIGPPPRGFVPPSSFVYEEDDHCQREFFPAANAGFLAHKVVAVEEHWAAEYSDSGFGSIHQRPAPPFPLAALNISLEALSAVLRGAGARHYPRVIVRAGPERLLIPEGHAFGSDAAAVVCVVKAGLVQLLWLQFGALPAAERLGLAALLVALGQRYSLLLADWETPQVVALADAAAVVQYLAEQAPARPN